MRNGPIHTAATKEIIDGLWHDVKSGAIDDQDGLEVAVHERREEFCLCIGEQIAIDEASEEMLTFIEAQL